ncbi:hypothetical protein HDV03_002887, partial [Kappamyces sp. JEL0829]
LSPWSSDSSPAKLSLGHRRRSVSAAAALSSHPRNPGAGSAAQSFVYKPIPTEIYLGQNSKPVSTSPYARQQMHLDAIRSRSISVSPQHSPALHYAAPLQPPRQLPVSSGKMKIDSLLASPKASNDEAYRNGSSPLDALVAVAGQVSHPSHHAVLGPGLAEPHRPIPRRPSVDMGHYHSDQISYSSAPKPDSYPYPPRPVVHSSHEHQRSASQNGAERMSPYPPLATVYENRPLYPHEQGYSHSRQLDTPVSLLEDRGHPTPPLPLSLPPLSRKRPLSTSADDGLLASRHRSRETNGWYEDRRSLTHRKTSSFTMEHPSHPLLPKPIIRARDYRSGAHTPDYSEDY